ncbi:hypothetical protein SVIOM342S_06644 [Streptomyces violaceorubidus]
MVAYLCQEPGKGETGRDVMERLRPLAQKLRVERGALDRRSTVHLGRALRRAGAMPEKTDITRYIG